MYAIKDNVQGEHMNPILLFINDEECKRAFKQAVNLNNGSHISMYYQDLSMYKLGEYDTKSGEIIPAYDYVCSGVDVKVLEQKVERVEEKKEDEQI